jgi:leader peptidase (prepilin peptidase)/N-methyltransferase
VLVALLFVLGLGVGPFIGIVIDRAVERERPEPSHRCQVCHQDLGRGALIPVRSWFLRCSQDPLHARWRYPVTDLLTACLFAAAGARFGWSWELGPYLFLFAALLAMSVIDLETHLLVDILTLRTLAVGIVLVLVLSGSNGAEDRIWPALIGAVLYGGFLGAAFLVYPPGLGFGDVKLAPTLGLFLGWLTNDPLIAVRLVLYAMVLAFLGGGLVGVLWNLSRGDRKAEIPMGPALALAAVVMVTVSSPDISGLLSY